MRLRSRPPWQITGRRRDFHAFGREHTHARTYSHTRVHASRAKSARIHRDGQIGAQQKKAGENRTCTHAESRVDLTAKPLHLSLSSSSRNPFKLQRAIRAREKGNSRLCIYIGA